MLSSYNVSGHQRSPFDPMRVCVRYLHRFTFKGFHHLSHMLSLYPSVCVSFSLTSLTPPPSTLLICKALTAYYYTLITIIVTFIIIIIEHFEKKSSPN